LKEETKDMAVLVDNLNTAVKPADALVSLATDDMKMRDEFQRWLIDGNTRKYTPEVVLSCMDRVSEYAIHKKIAVGSLWEYEKYNAFSPVYKKLLEAKLLRITDRNTHKVFIVAGQLYMQFLKQKPFAHKEAAALISDDIEGVLPVVLKQTPKHAINPEDVVAWLVTQPNANGTLYLENVVRTYMSALRNAPKRLILPEAMNSDVFSHVTLADFDTLWATFKESPNYIDVNRTPWHGQLSAGLAAYRRYLESVEFGSAYSAATPVSTKVAEDDILDINDSDSMVNDFRVDFLRPELCSQTKPVSCIVYGQAVVPRKQNWAQLLVAITERFIVDGNPNLESLSYEPLYGSKAFFLPQKADFGTCANLSTGKWIYTNYNPQTVVTIIGNLCRHCGVSLDDVVITYEPKGSKATERTQTFTLATTSLSQPETPRPVLNDTVVQQLTDVLSIHYSNGFRLNSPIEMTRFRAFAAEDLNKELMLSDEEVKAFIADCGITYEGKVYAISAEIRERVKELADKYFADGAQAIFFTEFYAKNEDWLFGASVVSEEMLTEIFRRLFPRLSFTQTYFGYTNASVFSALESEILRVWDGDVLLTYDQVAERLLYVPRERIKYALGQNGDFIWNSVETFSHVSRIEITTDEREAVRAAATRDCNASGYVSITDLPFVDIEERNYELSLAAVHNAVYRICLSDKFDKKGKIVTRKGDVFDALTIMKEYCRTIDKCSLDDLLNYEKELTGEVHRWIPMEAGNTILVRIDKEHYVADRFVHFDSNLIDGAIELVLKGDYLPLQSFTTFGAFPDCGQTWNLFLLESYCRRFSRIFRFDTPSVNSRNAGAVIRKSCGMEYAQVMTDAVANADILLTEANIGRFLYDRGYTGRSTTAQAHEIIEKAKAIRERRN
jgi:hypothetical protein